jgi:hypothetical protein
MGSHSIIGRVTSHRDPFKRGHFPQDIFFERYDGVFAAIGVVFSVYPFGARQSEYLSGMRRTARAILECRPLVSQ